MPQVNGVTNSILRVAEHLRDHGHQALIIAPSDTGVPDSYAGFPVATVASIAFPKYQDVRVSMTPSFVVDRLLTEFAPDVLHAGAPFLIGSTALLAAARYSIPSVAVYQTDVPSYAGRYGLSLLEQAAWARIRDIHSLANLTLAPSSEACQQLRRHGVPRVQLWGRGVDTTRFTPARRSQQLHDDWAPGGEVVVGYMGRLAPEKQVADLTVLAGLPGVRLVVVGDGPSAKALRAQLPQALFLGKLTGDDLARATASMDVFVHPGELETFGQAIQEALASGVPVVAPARGGPVDLIADGQRGFLYAPGDLAQLRAQVAALATDHQLRARLSQAARQYTTQRTWPVVCAQLVGYYHEAMRMTASATLDPR